MLGKLYVSPTSTPEKLHAAQELLTDAIEGRTATDAPSRNALNKLLTALTKAIGASGAATTTTTTATATATATKHEADEGHGCLTVCEDGVTGTNAEEHEDVVDMEMEGVEEGKGVDGGDREGIDSILDEAEAEEEL